MYNHYEVVKYLRYAFSPLTSVMQYKNDHENESYEEKIKKKKATPFLVIFILHQCSLGWSHFHLSSLQFIRKSFLFTPIALTEFES